MAESLPDPDEDLKEFDEDLSALILGLGNLSIDDDTQPPQRRDRITTVFNPLYQSSTSETSGSTSSQNVHVLHYTQPSTEGSSCEEFDGTRPKRKVSFSVKFKEDSSDDSRSPLVSNLSRRFSASSPLDIPSGRMGRRRSSATITFSGPNSKVSSSSRISSSPSFSPQSSPWSDRPGSLSGLCSPGVDFMNPSLQMQLSPSPPGAACGGQASGGQACGGQASGQATGGQACGGQAPVSQFLASQPPTAPVIRRPPSSPEWEGGVILERNLAPDYYPREVVYPGWSGRSHSFEQWFLSTCGGMYQQRTAPNDPQAGAYLTPFVHNPETDLDRARRPTLEDGFPNLGDREQVTHSLEFMIKLVVEIEGLLRKITKCNLPSHQKIAIDTAFYASLKFESMLRFYKDCMVDIPPEIFTIIKTCQQALNVACSKPDRSVAAMSSLAGKLIQRGTEVLFYQLNQVRLAQPSVRQRSDFKRQLMRADWDLDNIPLSPGYTPRTC